MLMLMSAEYYQFGLNHPIMQTSYNILVNVAINRAADNPIAKTDMKDLLEFEIELARVCSSIYVCIYTIPYLNILPDFSILCHFFYHSFLDNGSSRRQKKLLGHL